MGSSFIALLSVLLAAGAGVSFVMQQVVNASLRTSIGSAAWAGFISYLGGTFCMLLLALAMREGLPSTGFFTRSNWWAWSGGFFGAVYIAISIALVPRLGTAIFLAFFIAGQMLASLGFDQFGLFGLPQRSASLTRQIGAVTLIAGAVLVLL